MPTEPEYAHIDFASGELPELHEILDDLRDRYAVAPVQYHGGTAWLITRFDDLQAAFSDDDMFPSKAANIALIAASLVAFFGSFALIRTQTSIGDTAFLRSMIPHHSGAILMCQEAKLSDPEVIRLCEAIKRSQRQEIDEMKAILARR